MARGAVHKVHNHVNRHSNVARSLFDSLEKKGEALKDALVLGRRAPEEQPPPPVFHSIHRRADEKKEEIPESCTTGGFYFSPTIGQTIDPLVPVKASWDPTCLPSAKFVDIYLYAPGTANPRVYFWQKVPSSSKAKDGEKAEASYDLEIKPRWWEAKQGQELQLRVVPHGSQLFMSELPAGPVFIAKWETPANPSPQVADALDTTKINVGTTVVSGSGTSTMNPGKTAAAVILPLLVVAGLAFGYFKWKRTRGLEKRKNWAEQVDKRMSTISTDWKSVSVAGAQAAIRNSMAVNGGAGRTSFSFGNIRPSSQYAREGEFDEKDTSEFGAYGTAAAQKRPGVGLRNPSGLGMGADRVSLGAARVSRVSFADGTRPSMDSARRTRVLRDGDVPPVPVLPSARRPSNDSSADDNQTSGSLSPTQTQGAMTLTPEDIRARIAAGRARADSRAKTSFERDVTDAHGGMDDSVLPALKMMRTDGNDDDYLLAQSAHGHGVTAPAPTVIKPVTSTPTDSATPMSPVTATMPMLPATVMSPDDMLRAYAERKKSMALSTASAGTIGVPIGTTMNAVPVNAAAISYPQPAATNTTGGSGAGGRTIFGGTLSPNNTGGSIGNGGKEPTLGFAPGEYDPNFSFGGNTTGATGGAAANPYLQHAYSQQTYGAQQQQQYTHQTQQSYGGGDAYGGYDVAYGGAEYAIGDAEEDDVTNVNAANKGRKQSEDAAAGFAGRGAFGRR